MADPEDGRMNGEHSDQHLDQHLDEGVVHAWLDGQVAGLDAARIEAHIAGCAACAAIVAEARGFIAASSRILTGLDGVPARVVPQSRTRTRVWQVRAAAAVLIAALGAAAVLSDAGGRVDQIRREAAASREPPPASPAPALAKAADSEAAAPAAAPSPSPAASPARTTLRAAVPAPTQHARQVPQHEQQNEQQHQQQQMLQQKELQDQQRENKKAAALTDARQRSAAAQAGYLGDQALARDTAPAAPPSVMTSAFAAKAAPSGVGAYRQQLASADSTVPANVAGAFSVRRLASNAAYRRCAGQVVTVSQFAGANGGASAGAPAHLTTVRLDSAPQRAPVRGFVVAATNGQGSLGGWWIPAGADSAVVALTNPDAAAGTPMADSVGAGAGGATPATVTRVRCESP
jgi:hypothetical protein